jgi:hypothetical protein
MIAPEPYLTACLRVLSHATLEARRLAAQGKHPSSAGLSASSTEQIWELMDAVHNLPGLIHEWERCDEAWLRLWFVDYDAKWGERSHVRLLAVYESALKSPHRGV